MAKSSEIFNNNAAYKKRVQNAASTGAVQDVDTFYKNIPLEDYYNVGVKMPKGNQDQLTNPDEPWGKPEGWDYQTSKLGWRGEELPEGAVSWKPDGTAWYGGDNAFEDWWNSWQYKYNAAAEKSGSQYWDEAKKTFKDKDLGFLARLTGGLTAAVNAIGNVGLEEGEKPSGAAKVSRGIGQALMGIGTGLGRVAELTEKYVVAPATALEDIGDAGGVFSLEKATNQEEKYNKFEAWLGEKTNPILAANTSDAFRFLDQVGDVLIPTSLLWNGIRAAIAPISIKEKRDIMRDRIEAGEVLYSTWIEPATKAAYLDRVRSGEHPYLVATELQKPFAEMAGQALFDPLIVLGWLSKSKGAANTISNYTEYMTKPLNQFSDWFKTSAKGLVTFNDEAADLGKMAEAWIKTRKTAKGLLGDLSTELNVKGSGIAGQFRPYVNKALQRSGVFSWSASGKRHHLQRVTSDFMNTIITMAGKDPDEPLGIIKAVVALQSDNVDEVKDALAFLGSSKVGLNVFTSEAGTRFGAVMREMLLDANGELNGAQFINKFNSLKDDLPALQKWMDGRIDKVAQQMFPDLAKRADVLGKIEAGTELTAAEKLIDATALTGGEQFWLKAEQVANGKFLQKVNGFFSTVYMGYNPGYAFRNLITNELHALVDLGGKSYMKSWDMFNPKAADASLDYLTRGALGKAATQGVGSGGKGGAPTQKLASLFEKWGGQRIFGMKYKDTMEKGLKPILKEVGQQLRAAGADDEAIAVFESVAKITHGRMDEALEAVRSLNKNGKMSMFETATWLPDETRQFIRHHNLEDRVLQIIREGGESAADIQGKMDELFDDVYKFMKQSEKQISMIAKQDGEAVGELAYSDDFQATVMDWVSDNNAKATLSMAGEQNKLAERTYKTAANSAREIAREQKIDVSDIRALLPDDLENADEVVEGIKSVLDGTFHEPFHERWREQYHSLVEKMVNDVRSGNITIEKAWKQIPFLREEPPIGMTSKEFGDLIYNVVLPHETRKFYQPIRNSYAGLSELYIEGVKKAGVVLDETFEGIIGDARKRLHKAAQYDTHIIRDLEFDDLGRATGGDLVNLSLGDQRYRDYVDVRKLGAMNGIETARKVPGDPNRAYNTNHLLNAINKQLRGMGLDEYAHLDQVPYDVAEKALKARAAEKGVDFRHVWRPPQTKVDIPPAVTTLLEEAKITKAATKTAQMDQRVSEAVRYMASEFKIDLDASIMGGGIWGEKQDALKGLTGEILPEQRRWSTRYPSWYKKSEVGGSSAYYKGQKGRKAVMAALSDIIDGKDGDEAIMIKLRQALLDRMDQTPDDFLYSIRNKIQAYAKEPSMVDEMLELSDDAVDPFVGLRDEYGNLLESWGLTDDDFFSTATSIPSVEHLSSPHAFLSAGGQIRDTHLQLNQLIGENFGRYKDTFDNPGLINSLEEIGKFSSQRETELRLTANEVATHGRNFALLNYESRRNIDTLTGMLMPYQFWYGRTYTNWAQRVVKDPAIVANYYRYKQAMAEVHAGMPEFWQQNVNSYELFGLFKDNPLYFNLEQTLNPLQGLTGTDFEDPAKRVDGWSATLMDLNRFGPTTHPIYNYALAFAYMLKGENEAAARWGGRLFPQTASLNALGNIVGSEGLQKEFDPAVWLFSGGIDPYMRRRVGRALPQMIMEGMITPEQAIDASWSQQGHIWESARMRAIGERAPGQLASFFLGVGFKGRNQGDIQTDYMYNDFYSLMNRRETMSGDQFKLAMNELSKRYPFMDSVLISAKTGYARDMAFAYSILGRIPPGASRDFYDAAGVDNRLVQKFYNSKGDMDDWPESDRKRFMAGVIDLNAILEIPDDYTSDSWTDAKARYSQVTDQMEKYYGDDIQEQINAFYALKNMGEDQAADQFLKDNPSIEKAMTWQTQVIISDPALQPYYSSLKKIEGYYFGQMYQEAKEKFGEDIFNVQTGYFTMQTPAEKKQFLRENPQLKEYWSFRDEAGRLANQQVIDLAAKLPQGLPATIREDADQSSVFSQDVAASLEEPDDPFASVSVDDWYNELGSQDFAAIYNYLEGDPFTSSDKRRLRTKAENMGLDLDRLVQYVGISLNQFDENDLPNP